jgi:hypothetical protein
LTGSLWIGRKPYGAPIVVVPGGRVVPVVMVVVEGIVMVVELIEVACIEVVVVKVSVC